MIGIFDSGMGGLTVMRAIRDRLPSSDIVYFGDTKHAPYGMRSRRELSELTIAGLKRLQDNGATSVVSACNSVSASLALSLLDTFSLASDRLIEMVGPTVRAFQGVDARLALCATQATIDSGIYQDAFLMLGHDVATYPIPELAGAIERGAPEEELEMIIKRAFTHSVPFDVLILACTHYPLVRSVFAKVLGIEVVLFDPALAVAERVEAQFWPREVGEGKTRFLLSQESAPFRAMVAKRFPEHAKSIEVVE